MALLENVEARLKAFVFERRIRLKDLFENLHHLHHCRMSTANFRRTLDSAGFPLDDQELESLVNRYHVVHKKESFVDYFKFVKEIDSVFGPQALEKDPSQKISDGRLFVKLQKDEELRRNRGHRVLTEKDYDLISYCIERVRDRIRHRYIELKSVFKDFDKINSGTVSRTQFHKCLTSLGFRFTDEAIEILQWRYTSSRHATEVDYLAFLRDVDGYAVPGVDAMPPKEKTSHDHSGEKTTLAECLYRIREHSLTRRARLLPFFRDSDPLRSNRIAVQRFRSTLDTIAGLHLNDEELELLRIEFQHHKDPNSIDYSRFNDAVERAHTFPHLEKSPSTEVERMTIHSRVKDYDPASEALSDVGKSIDDISSWIRFRKVSLMSFFRDFDRAVTGTISSTQFRSVLTSHGYEAPGGSVKVLVKRFGRDPSGIDYRCFLRALERHIQHTEHDVAATTPSSDSLVPKPAPESIPMNKSLAFDVAFDKLKSFVFSRRIRLEEFFRDLDPLQTGRVVVPTFFRILHLAGYQCSEDEAMTIARPFIKPHLGMPQLETMIYTDFLKQINKVFGVSDLEKHPSVSPRTFERGHARGKNTLSGLNESPEDTKAIEQLLNRLYSQAYRYSLNPAPWFSDFDKQSHGYVTRRQFLSVLSNCGFQVSDQDMKLLYLRYHKEENQHFMEYQQFCLDMEKFAAAKLSDKVGVDDSALERVAPASDADSKVSSTPSATELVLNRIRTLVLRRGIRVEEFFQDYDGLRSGLLSPDIVRRVLSVHSISISDVELKELEIEYGNPMRYNEFVHDINKCFVPTNIEKQPHLHKVSFIPFDPDALRNDLEESPEETEIIERVLDEISRKVQQRGINLKPYLDDGDHNNDGSISGPPFHSIISNFVQRITVQENNLLLKRFHRGSNIDYGLFLDEVERRANADAEDSSPVESTGLIRKVQTSPYIQKRVINLDTILKRIETEGKASEIRVRDWFEDFDKLRSGRVSIGVFGRVLDLMKLTLTKEEIDVLVSFYFDPESKQVQYDQFCRDIEDAFHPRDLEKNPSQKLNKFVPINLHNDVGENSVTLSPNQEDIADNTLKRLAAIAFKRRFPVKEYFKTFDRTHRGSIPRVRLSSVLMNLFLVPLSSEAIEALCVLFRKGDQVDYIRFSEEMRTRVDELDRRHQASHL